MDAYGRLTEMLGPDLQEDGVWVERTWRIGPAKDGDADPGLGLFLTDSGATRDLVLYLINRTDTEDIVLLSVEPSVVFFLAPGSDRATLLAWARSALAQGPQ